MLQAKWDKVWEHMQNLMDTGGMPQDTCLCLTLQVLQLLPTILLDISFHAPFPMMLTYGQESYSSQAWLKNEEETYSLGENARASHILSKKLEQMAGSSPSQAHSCDSSVESSQPHSPSNSLAHSMSRSVLWLPKWDSSNDSSASSIHSHTTAKESHASSGRGSEDKVSSTVGNMSEHESDGDSEGKGSGSRGSGSEDLESKDGPEGKGSNNEGSGSKSREFCSKDEESGSGSGSSSSASESDWEAPKAKLDQLPPEAPSEMDHNVSQAPSIPEVDDKDSEDEQKNSHHDLAHSLDVAFSEWRDHMISEGHKEWAKWDKMISDHMDPTKRAKHADLLGTLITYMESQGAFKAIKTSEYGLSHFYQVRASGDFSTFPEPQEPMMSDDIHCLLQKAHELLWPN